MSEPIRVLHGSFGRVALLRLDHSMTSHAHRDAHFVFKVEGPDILFGIGQKEYLVSEKTVLFINAWEPHFYNHKPTCEDTILLAFYFKPNWLEQIDARFIQNAYPDFFNFPIHKTSKKIENLRDEVLNWLEIGLLPTSYQMNKLISDLYIEGLEISVPDLKKVSISKYSELRYDPRIRKVINQILNNNLSTLNWAKVADSVGLSRAHFFRLFSNSTGVSPTTFTNTLKMEQGLMLLSDLNLPIQNIAEAVGFVPMNNFTRFFSAHQGVTPSKYRKVMDIVK